MDQSWLVYLPTLRRSMGFRVWKSGKALSKITPAESGSDYSLHTKVKGDAVLRFPNLREYISHNEQEFFFKETLLNTTNPTVEYSTYEKTITLDNTTQSVVLVLKAMLVRKKGQYALFTNTASTLVNQNLMANQSPMLIIVLMTSMLASHLPKIQTCFKS